MLAVIVELAKRKSLIAWPALELVHDVKAFLRQPVELRQLPATLCGVLGKSQLCVEFEQLTDRQICKLDAALHGNRRTVINRSLA
jgi:hypothetical protein